MSSEVTFVEARDIRQPEWRPSRADFLKAPFSRYVQRLGERVTDESGRVLHDGTRDLRDSGLTFAQIALTELRQLEREVEAANGDVRTVAKARREREARLESAYNGTVKQHRELIAKLSDELATFTTVDAFAEREVRDVMRSLPANERTAFIRANPESAIVASAVVNSPYASLFSDSQRSEALANFNSHFRTSQAAALQSAEFFVGTIEHLRDTVAREFKSAAPVNLQAV